MRKQAWIKYIGMLLIGVLIGWLAFSPDEKAESHAHDHGAETVYTCSMDPQIKQDKPGNCPICGMELIPLQNMHARQDDVSSDAVMLSDEAAALANIQTEVVGTAAGCKEVRLFGKIEPDQRLQQSQTAYVGGRIERLYVSAVGDRVGKGQTLAVIYSPELYAAQQELVAALGYPDEVRRKTLVQAATEKLRLLNVTQAQINEVLSNKKASPYVSLKANTSGTVVSKHINQGDYVKQGDELLQIADLSRVWAVFEAYESDLPFVKVGAAVRFTTEVLPGKTFTGKVSFVNPILNGQTRTAGVRVVLNNSGNIFKPEMMIAGYAAGSVDKDADGVTVPKSAVLWTGQRSVVYVQDESQEQPTFELREVTLGASLPDSYVVTEGLAEGETIVTNGVFAIDASAQLSGKKSMMNRE